MIKKLASFLVFAVVVCCAVHAQQYTWKDVKVGGGGFVSGLIFNPSQKDLLYARTDVGGAYRWDAGTASWLPLTDFLGQDDENYSGVLSLATDPTDVNRVYMATGLYTQWWAGNGAVFSSTDKGNTWARHDLSIKLGGNEDGRNTGERLVVDPNKGSILYLGSSKDGLWKSVDYGSTWNKVTSFPVSTFTGAGVSFIQFDKSSATTGNATQTIYVGITQTGTSIYKSINGGATWTAVTGQPTTLMPLQATLASNGMMYVTYADAPGPNGISTGAVYKLNTSSNTWTALTLPTGQGGYCGVSVDASNANTIIVSTIDRWWPHDEIFRSTDGGGTWTALLDGATWNYSAAPYTSNYTAHWIADVEIDPFDNNKAWFVTGYGVYQTANIKNAGSDTPVTWAFKDNGLEELVATALVSPATGVPLLSAVGDQDGFRHNDLDVSPAAGKYSPSYGGNNSIDVAQSNPDYVVRTYYAANGNYGSYSTNQGVTWTKFASYPLGTTGAGNIAVSADASHIVWSPDGASTVYYSVNNGSSWVASTGIAAGLMVTGDKKNAQKFYAYNATAGTFLASANGGASFSNGATGLPTLQSWELWMAQTRAVFGIEGDVWFTSGYNGLYHSTNSGASFIKISGVDAAYKIAFGKAANGAAYPAIYVQGRVSNVYGFYRSTDGGVSWLRINDDSHNFLAMRAFAADPKTFGRVYLGTSGRGIVYGDDATTLPVLFTSISVAQRAEDKMQLADIQWTTGTDINTAYFVVEKSTGSPGWNNLATVKPGGQQPYRYTDNVTTLNGTVYYRIKAVDNDGKINYSSVVSLKHASVAKTTIIVSPNPIENGVVKLRINSTQEQKIIIRLVDINGRILYTSGATNLVNGENVIALPATNFAKGNIGFAEVLSATERSKIGMVKLVY